MADPFLAEVRLLSFNFAPKGWAMCNGQILPINQNQALFSLLGTTYGGNGINTFALPNLQGRTPIHVGNGHVEGETGGETAHTLTIAEMPGHRHPVPCSKLKGNQPSPAGVNRTMAAEAAGATAPYAVNVPDGQMQEMNGGLLANAGGGQPHENQMPYLVITFAIALQGIFPSRN